MGKQELASKANTLSPLDSRVFPFRKLDWRVYVLTHLRVFRLPVVVDVNVLGRDDIEAIGLKALHIRFDQNVGGWEVKRYRAELVKSLRLRRNASGLTDQAGRLVSVRILINLRARS